MVALCRSQLLRQLVGFSGVGCKAELLSLHFAWICIQYEKVYVVALSAPGRYNPLRATLHAVPVLYYQILMSFTMHCTVIFEQVATRNNFKTLSSKIYLLYLLYCGTRRHALFTDLRARRSTWLPQCLIDISRCQHDFRPRYKGSSKALACPVQSRSSRRLCLAWEASDRSPSNLLFPPIRHGTPNPGHGHGHRVRKRLELNPRPAKQRTS